MVVLGPILTLIACGFAFAVGGGAERRGAALVLVAQAVALAGRLVAGPAPVWPVIAADVVLAAGLLTLAALSMRAWILAALFVVALILIAHSLLLDPEGEPVTPLYRGVVDGLNVAGLAALTVGAAQSARQRRAMAPRPRRGGAGRPGR